MSNYQIMAKGALESISKQISYTQLGEMLGIPARAVGQVLKALARRGYGHLCTIVIYKKALAK